MQKLALMMVVLTLALLPGARAQMVPQPSASYLLGADDVISIQVINFPELSVPQLTVPPDGKISVQFIDNLPVAGRTTAQVARALTLRWNDYVNDPSVTVTLTQKRRQSVQIYGFVAHAQSVDYQSGLSLSQVLAQAGGAADSGDLSQVRVTHKDGRKQTVDLSGPQAAGGSDQDMPLEPDDVIYVPQRHTQISVLGEVAKPGSFDYKAPMTVLDALQTAGGINPETADLSHAVLVHDGQESTLNLDALLRKDDLTDNVKLAAGDNIFVPELHNRIYVDGAVNKPGYYLFKPGDRLLDAINGSGGTQAGVSDLAKVSVIHVDKLHNTATTQTVDVFKFYRTGDMQANIPLSPGDAVYVPLKGASRRPLDILGNALGLATGFRVLSRP